MPAEVIEVCLERRACFGMPWRTVRSLLVGTEDEIKVGLGGNTLAISRENVPLYTLETTYQEPNAVIALENGQGGIRVDMSGFAPRHRRLAWLSSFLFSSDFGYTPRINDSMLDRRTSLPTDSGNSVIRTNYPRVEITTGSRLSKERVVVRNHDAAPRMHVTPEEVMGLLRSIDSAFLYYPH